MDPNKVIPVTDFVKAMAMLSLSIPAFCVDGKPLKPGGCWEWRLISTRDLEENGCETIEDAEEKGIEGEIAYGFGPHPDRERIMAAFDRAWKLANENSDMEVPNTIQVLDAKGKKQEINSAEVIAMGIAFAFRNADFWFPRRTQVLAKLHVTTERERVSDNTVRSSFQVLDRRTPPEVIEKLTQ